MNTPTMSKKRKRFRMVIPAYPAFNIYSQVAEKTTALGPVCVATAVREMPGWDVEVIDENNLRLFGPRADPVGADHDFLQAQRPADVVGFYGGLSSTIPRLYELARLYKKKGVGAIAGGVHFVGENIAEGLNAGLDYIVLGEGEETIKELLDSINHKREPVDVKGVAYLKNGSIVQTPPRQPMTDFDSLPLPDFSLLRYAAIKLYPVERIRGCAMACEFCTVKGSPRSASPERLLEAIRSLVEKRDARHFFIVDDLFGQQRDETLRFCQVLKEYQKKICRRLDFSVQIRLDKARDTQLLLEMRHAGINMVAIGLESPIEEELKAMNKKIRPEEMIRLARVFHRFGFLVHGMFIFGYPMADGEHFIMSAEERIKRFRAFIRKARIDTIQVLLPVPLPGTELRQRLIKQGRIYPKEDIGWEYYDGNFPIFEPDKPLTAFQMQLALRKIMGNFYAFRYMLGIALDVFSFPALVFFLYNIKFGWRRWYRSWRNDLMRFGGWIVLKGWTSQLQKGQFFEKLALARVHLKKSPKG